VGLPLLDLDPFFLADLLDLEDLEEELFPDFPFFGDFLDLEDLFFRRKREFCSTSRDALSFPKKNYSMIQENKCRYGESPFNENRFNDNVASRRDKTPRQISTNSGLLTPA